MKYKSNQYSLNSVKEPTRYGTWTSGVNKAPASSFECQIPYPSQSKDLVFLTERVRKLLEISKSEESLEEKILRKFGQLPTLEQCLKYCLEEYAEKENQFRESLETAVELNEIAKNMVELSAEASRRCQEAKELIDDQAVELQKLENQNQQLHEEVAKLRNWTDYMAMECYKQKQNRNQMIKQALRQTYQSDKEQIDRMAQVLNILEREIQKRTAKIIEYEFERAQFQRQLKESKLLVDDLSYENKKLKQQMQLLQSNLKKSNQGQICDEKFENQIISAILAVTKSTKRQSEEGSKTELHPPNTISSMKRADSGLKLFQKVNRYQVSTKKQLGQIITQTKHQSKIQLPIRLKEEESISKVKKLKKIKSMTIRPYDKDVIQRFATEQHQEGMLEQNRNFEKNHKILVSDTPPTTSTEGPKQTIIIGENHLYKVASIQRFSEISEVNRFSEAFYNNLAEQCREGDKVEKYKNVKSIGLMTEPNEEQQFINSRDFDSPIHSPYKHPKLYTPLHVQKNTLHKSCLINQSAKELKFFPANKSNGHMPSQKTVPNMQDSEPKSQNVITSIFQNIVSRRTHKNIPNKEKPKENKDKLSQSFIQTFSYIKQSFVGGVSPDNDKKLKDNQKAQSSKYLSKSTVWMNEKQVDMSKKNRPYEVEDRDKQPASNFMNTIFDFAVRRRIKK